MNAEIRSKPDWMLMTVSMVRLDGRRLRIFLGEETFYDALIEVLSANSWAQRYSFDGMHGPWEACCVKVMLNATVYYLSGDAVSQIRETDMSFVGTDLILILRAESSPE